MGPVADISQARSGGLARPRRRADVAWIVLLFACIAVPVLAALIVTLRHRGPAVDDFAIIEFQLRHLFSANTPLTGSYSRAGWHHPGPLMFWVLEPFWVAAGRSTVGMYLAVPMLAGVFLATSLVLALRVSRAHLALVSLVTVATVVGLAPWFLLQPWNPWLVVPALVCFMTLALRVSVGRTRDLIGMVVVGSFIVQTHASGAILVAVGAVFALGAVVVDARSARRLPPHAGSTLAWSVAAAVVLWFAPMLGVIRHEPGSLISLLRYFTDGGRPTLGMHVATQIVARQFAWRPPALGAGYQVTGFGGSASLASPFWLIVPVAASSAGFLASIRQPRDSMGRRVNLRTVTFATAWFVASVIAVRSADEPRAYAFAWCVLTCSFVVLAAAMAVTRLAANSTRFPVRTVVSMMVLILCALGSVRAAMWVIKAKNPPLEWTASDLASFRAESERRWPSGSERIRVEAAGTFVPSLREGIVDALDARGVRVGVPPADSDRFNAATAMSRTAADEVWYVTQEGSVAARLAALPGARVLWRSTPLAKQDEDELATLQASVENDLIARGDGDLVKWLDSAFVGLGSPRRRLIAAGIDAQRIDRLEALNWAVAISQRCRCAVVAVDAARVGRGIDNLTGRPRRGPAE